MCAYVCMQACVPVCMCAYACVFAPLPHNTVVHLLMGKVGIGLLI